MESIEGDGLPSPLVKDSSPTALEARAARHLRRVAGHVPDAASVVRHVRTDDIIRRSRRRRVGSAITLLFGAGLAMAGVGWALRPALRTVEPESPVALLDPPAFESRTASPIVGEVVPPTIPSEAPSTSADLDLKVFTATYLGGTGDDAPVAVAVLDAQTILHGGILGQGDLGTTAHQLFDGGDAALVRLGRQGRNVLSVTRIGRSLTDMKVDSLGRVLVLGQPFGLAALDNSAQKVLWKTDVLGTRLGVGSDGTIGVLNALDGAVRVISPAGQPLASFSLGNTLESLSDIAVHGPSQTIIVTGTRIGATKQALIRAYGYDGTPRWQAYGWSDAETRTRRLTAASQGVRVLVGPDESLYFLGVSNGGNSTFLRKGNDLDSALPGLANFDSYTSPTKVGNQNLLVVARLDAREGVVESLVFHLTRDWENGEGGTMNPHALAVDTDGRVLVTGYQTRQMERQKDRLIAGRPLRLGGRDAFVLGLNPDLRGRWLWSTWGTGAPSAGIAVALGHGMGVMAAFQTQSSFERAPLVTVDALYPTPVGGPSDGYLASWPILPLAQ